MNELILPVLTLLNLKKIGRKSVFSLIKGNESILNCKNYPTEIVKELLSRSTTHKFSCSEIVYAYDAAMHKLEKTLSNHRIKITTYWDELFPNSLKTIDDPPLFLTYIGKLEQLNYKKSVAVIGTRETNPHIDKIAFRLGELLAKYFIITSGLAKGCDTEGHKGCLKANGITVAVCGKPLDTIYPKENSILADEILQKNGILISEYLVGEKIFRQAFVERDRIQAGLSEAIVVVATGLSGGSMHTVEFGKNYKKMICCYSPISSQEKEDKLQGNIKLIYEGATPIVNSQSIKAIIEKLQDEHLPEAFSDLPLFDFAHLKGL